MDFVTTLFTGPILPASLLLGLMLCWSLLAMLGALDIDLPGTDFDPDVDVDMDSGGASDTLGFLALRWLNISEVPLVLWLGVFSVIWWFFAASLWSMVDSRFLAESPGWIWSTVLTVRNLLIAVLLTKWATQPMKAWFIHERHSSQSLIGKECYISSSEATPEFGQVKFQTDGAPLLLNVRTDGVHLAQGAHVWITHYDAKRRVYIVSPTTADPLHVETPPEERS